jgi:hypothetical protein
MSRSGHSQKMPRNKHLLAMTSRKYIKVLSIFLDFLVKHHMLLYLHLM